LYSLFFEPLNYARTLYYLSHMQMTILINIFLSSLVLSYLSLFSFVITPREFVWICSLTKLGIWNFRFWIECLITTIELFTIYQCLQIVNSYVLTKWCSYTFSLKSKNAISFSILFTWFWTLNFVFICLLMHLYYLLYM